MQGQLLQFFAQQLAAERELMQEVIAASREDNASVCVANRAQIDQILKHGREDSAVSPPVACT